MKNIKYTKVRKKTLLSQKIKDVLDHIEILSAKTENSIIYSLIKKFILAFVYFSVFIILANIFILNIKGSTPKHIEETPINTTQAYKKILNEMKIETSSKGKQEEIPAVTSNAKTVDNVSEAFYDYITSDNSLVGDGTIGMKYDDYEIGEGENLTTISRKIGANLDTIVSVNKISNANRLKPGQTLKIPNRNGLLYTVKNGESLADIADRYDVQLERILHFNKIDNPNAIASGTDIFLPGARYTLDERIDKFGQMFSLPTTIYRISSPFGYRIHPIKGVRIKHLGVDIPGGVNTPVYAARKGKVIFAGYSGGYGNLVIVRHDKGFTTYYAHLNKITTYSGANVGVGTVIGRMGSTGGATGNHLHFEIRRHGEALNPADYIPIAKFLKRKGR